jgi:hypothetical protein
MLPSTSLRQCIFHIQSSRSQHNQDLRSPIPTSGHPGTHAKQTSGLLLHSHTTPSPVQVLMLRNPAASISPSRRSSIFRGLVWPPEVFACQMRRRSPTPSVLIRPKNRDDRSLDAYIYAVRMLGLAGGCRYGWGFNSTSL